LWTQIVGNEGKNPFFMLWTAEYGVFSTIFDVLTVRFAFQRHEKQAYNRRITHASSPKCKLLGGATEVIGVKMPFRIVSPYFHTDFKCVISKKDITFVDSLQKTDVFTQIPQRFKGNTRIPTPFRGGVSLLAPSPNDKPIWVEVQSEAEKRLKHSANS
jgi:hypothetical protein